MLPRHVMLTTVKKDSTWGMLILWFWLLHNCYSIPKHCNYNTSMNLWEMCNNTKYLYSEASLLRSGHVWKASKDVDMTIHLSFLVTHSVTFPRYIFICISYPSIFLIVALTPSQKELNLWHTQKICAWLAYLLPHVCQHGCLFWATLLTLYLRQLSLSWVIKQSFGSGNCILLKCT